MFPFRYQTKVGLKTLISTAHETLRRTHERLGLPALKLPRLPEDIAALRSDDHDGRLIGGRRRDLSPARSQLPSRYREEFQELKHLGKGGFGSVVAAKNVMDDKVYAVKKILMNKPSSTSYCDRIIREVKILARLGHENVVAYHSAWMEYDDDLEENPVKKRLDNENLEDCLARGCFIHDLTTERCASSGGVRLDVDYQGKISNKNVPDSATRLSDGIRAPTPSFFAGDSNFESSQSFLSRSEKNDKRECSVKDDKGDVGAEGGKFWGGGGDGDSSTECSKESSRRSIADDGVASSSNVDADAVVVDRRENDMRISVIPRRQRRFSRSRTLSHLLQSVNASFRSMPTRKVVTKLYIQMELCEVSVFIAPAFVN